MFHHIELFRFSLFHFGYFVFSVQLYFIKMDIYHAAFWSDLSYSSSEEEDRYIRGRKSSIITCMIYVFISVFYVVPAGYAFSLCLLCSDNSIVCFRQKYMLAGFTTSVSLIWYLTCVISWKLDFYSNLFECSTLCPTYPREVKLISCNGHTQNSPNW